MPAEGSSLTERVLRCDRWIMIAALAALTLLSWAYLFTGAGTGMSAWAMTSASLFPHRLADASIDSMHPGAWSLGYWIIILLMWWVMMIAMMIPSAAPTILLYARQRGASPTAFASGYLLVWLGFSVLATALMWALESAGLTSAMMMSSLSAWLSAAILIGAGVYQLTPLKRRCLRHCRGSAAFIAHHWQPGASGALRMGLEHGVYCVGCCWVLMGLLFVGGVMNVLWIGVLALFMVVEKLARHGGTLSWFAGLVLLAWGVTTLLV